jgi:hypothetical protein
MHLYSLAKTDSEVLLLLDYDTGRLSRLRMNENEWVGGPSIGVDSPIVVRVKIAANALTIDHDGATTVANLFEPFTAVPVAGGMLYLPRAGGRHPAIVGVPGAGNATRRSISRSWRSTSVPIGNQRPSKPSPTM